MTVSCAVADSELPPVPARSAPAPSGPRTQNTSADTGVRSGGGAGTRGTVDMVGFDAGSRIDAPARTSPRSAGGAATELTGRASPEPVHTLPQNPRASDAGAAPREAPGTARTDCPAAYTLATHIVIDVGWAGSLALNTGTGQVHVWTKSKFVEAGDEASLMSQSCGSVLPEIKLSILAGGYSVLPEIPDAAWDAPSMPTFAGRATRAGSTWTVSPGVALVGLSMPDPLAPWPAAGSIAGLDHDSDGNLGITALPRQGGNFIAPPTNLAQTARVDKLFLAIRTVMTLTSTRAGCPETDEGTADVTQFDNHIIGCHVAGGSDCTAAERDFVDGNRTVYKIQGARFSSRRVNDNATCADIRAAMPIP